MVKCANRIKFFTKTLIKVTDYVTIRMMCNSDNNYIGTFLQIQKRNRALEYLDYNASKKIIQELKINGCAICGYNKCKSALEFHHANPEDKKFLIGKAFIRGHCNKKIATELNKCILLCANCHREVETKEIKNGK